MLVSDGDQHRPERSGESCHGFAALPKSARRADFPLLRGERVPVGGRSPVENSAVASDIAERAPPGHSNRSDPFSFVNSVVLDVCHRHTATEPAGEKAKGFLLFVGPPNFNLLNWDFRP